MFVTICLDLQTKAADPDASPQLEARRSEVSDQSDLGSRGAKPAGRRAADRTRKNSEVPDQSGLA